MITGSVESHYIIPDNDPNDTRSMGDYILGYLNKHTKGLTMPWEWYLEDMPHIKITWSWDQSLQRIHVYVIDTSTFEGA